MIKTDTTLVSKHQLLDYISKRDFNDFVVDMRDFREVTEKRFDTIEYRLSAHDKRFDEINRRLDKMSEDMRIQVGAVMDQFRENSQITMEYVQNIEKTKVDEIRFNALKKVVDSWGPRIKPENHNK